MRGHWGKLLLWFAISLVGGTAIIAVPYIGGGGGWLPESIAKEASSIDALFWGLVAVCIVIFAIVSAIVLYSMVAFRARPGDERDGEHIHGSVPMEVAWVVIPTIIVTVISVVSFVVLRNNEVGLYEESSGKKGAATMNVDVRAFSFGWEFRYDDESETSPDLVLPEGEIVRFEVMSCSGSERLGRVREEERRRLAGGEGAEEFADIPQALCEREWNSATEEDVDQAKKEARQLFEIRQRNADGPSLSREERDLLDAQPEYKGDDQYIDVNHAFWVPEARLKIDAVSGLQTYTQWSPDQVTEPGTSMQVVCAELCGSGHNNMRNEVCIVDRETFAWWLDLDEDARRDASCVNLILLRCEGGGDVDDYGERVARFAGITRTKPDATCDDVEGTA